MNINIYQKYKVKKTLGVAFIDVENSTLNDISFKDEEKKAEEILDGGKLIDYIVKLLADRDISEFKIKENIIEIEHFNPLNGEGASTYIEIKEIIGR